MNAKKTIRRQKIRYRVRKNVNGTAEKPRLSVFRSNKDVYVQLIDDSIGHTIAAATSRGTTNSGTKVEQAKEIGAAIAKKALEAGIDQVVFDRGGYLYHGRVKAVSDGAREAGLKF